MMATSDAVQTLLAAFFLSVPALLTQQYTQHEGFS